MIGIVVLGCCLEKYQDTYHPGDILKSRLEKCLELCLTMENDGKDYLLILTGGGSNPVSEASCMKKWLMDRGVAEEFLLIEDKSMSTIENAINTNNVINRYNTRMTSPTFYGCETTLYDGAKTICFREIKELLVLTSEFHMQRSKLIFDYIFNTMKINYVSSVTPIIEYKKRIVFEEKNTEKTQTLIENGYISRLNQQSKQTHFRLFGQVY